MIEQFICARYYSEAICTEKHSINGLSLLKLESFQLFLNGKHTGGLLLLSSIFFPSIPLLLLSEEYNAS